MGFAAINAVAHDGEESRARESLEAQESRIANTYATGLRFVEEGRKSEAVALFESLLNEVLLHNGDKGNSMSAASAAQLRYLVLKNLANLLASDDATAPRALHLYAQALMLDDGNAVVWNNMGTLAAELGRWGLARTVWEHGLRRHPKHAIMAEKLVEVLLQLGDWQAAASAVERLLAQDPSHPRAVHLRSASADPGHLLGDLTSPFKRRSAAVDPAAPAQTLPAVISIPSATWSALLGAVATALKAPQRIQSQLGRQILGPVRLELPPEHPQAEISDDHSSEVMDIDIINTDPPAAVMPAQQGIGPAADVIVGQSSAKEAAPARIDRAAASGLPEAAKAEPEQEQGSQKSEKGGEDASKAAPARASRRLEARREGHVEPGEAAEAEELNILAQLRPFLSEQPPSTDPPPLRAAQAPAADSQKDAVVRPSVQTDAANEEQAVRAYVAANGQAVSLPTAGVQLLSSLSAQKWEEGAGVISKQILALVSALGPSWRPEGEAALTVAEVTLSAAGSMAGGRSTQTVALQENMHPGRQVDGAVAPALADKKAKTANKRKGPHQSTMTKLLADCETLLGHYLMSTITGSADSSISEEIKEEQKIRHQWALARIAELRKDVWTAGKQYAACQELCKQVEANHADSWSITLPYCLNASIISSSAAKAKVDSLKSHQVLDSAKTNLEGGRADQVIAELAPILLGEAGSASHGLLSSRQSILEGLQLLQDAAVTMQDAACELRCRLSALKSILPLIPEHVDDLDRHTAPACGPPPAGVNDLQKPFKVLVTEALTDLADFVASHEKAGDLPALANSLGQQMQLLKRVQWQAALLVERAFWSFHDSPLPTSRPSGRLKSAKAAARQGALLASCMGFCAMHQLQLSIQNPSIASIAAEEMALSTVCSILARREVLLLQRGSFVRMALGRFSHALSILKSLVTDSATDQAAKTELVVLVDSNLARCLQLLYGVTLPQRNQEWGVSAEEIAGGASLHSDQECTEVWKHIGPYAESLETDSKMLGRLQGVLEAVQNHFKAPPQSVLEAWDPVKLLDSLPFDKADVYSSMNISLVSDIQQSDELKAAVANDTHAAVHCSLHRLLDILKPDLETSLQIGDGLCLTEEGARIVERVASLAAYSLRYNTRCLRSWDSLANTYKEAASDILNEAANELSVGQFFQKQDLKARFELYQRRALWASLVARQVAADASMADDVPNLDEQIGNVLYEELQNCPPLYDQLTKDMNPDAKRLLIQNAAQAYEKALSGLPDEWMYACYHGKLHAKLGDPPETWLLSMARAVRLSVLHAGGMVEAFYQLHSQRLKLLLRDQTNLALLKAVARFCSMEKAAEEAQALSDSIASPEAGSISHDSLLSKVKHILISDCIAAMQFCLECDKGYHKAAFQIAKALVAQGRKKEAVQQLQGLFSKPRHVFCINIWEIIGGPEVKTARSTEAEASAEDAGAEAADDSLWGRQPASIAGNGLDEPFRKFAACRRKYMLLYFELLQVTGGFDMLLAAHAFLQSQAQWPNPAIMADMARIAMARCVVGMAACLNIYRQALGMPNPQGNAKALEGRDKCLQQCCTLYAEHLVTAEQPLSAAAVIENLPDTTQADREAAEWALEEGFHMAAQCWVGTLGAQRQLDDLQDMLAALRKHFKGFIKTSKAAQAFVRLLAATLAHTVDSSLTCLGTEPCITSSRLNTGPEPNSPNSIILPASPAAMAALGAQTSLTTASQPSLAASAPVSSAPLVAASSAVPASLAPPAIFSPIAAAAAAQQQAAAAVPRMPVPPLQGGHEDLARVCLNRLGLDPAVVAILMPFMPSVLAQILPGTSPVEKEQLLRYIMSPLSFDNLGRAGQGQIILSVCQRNAEDVAHRYSAAPSQPVVPAVTSALPPLVMVPGSQPSSAGPSAADQAATAVQRMAPQNSAPQELHIHHQAAKGLGSFLASDSRAGQALQPLNPPGTSVGAAQQQSVATSNGAGMGQGGAPARTATVGPAAAAAALSVAMQLQQAPQQLPETSGRVVESASPPPGKGQPEHMEQAAQSREEVLQLMKHSRYLHKSGISKLPAEPNEPAVIAEGLAKIDSNMVRAYRLYMRLMGRGSQLGPNVTAAEAATGYEEVAKTLKGASPAKLGRTSRDKSGTLEGGHIAKGVLPEQNGSEPPAKRPRREGS